jgi:hypothetical protein
MIGYIHNNSGVVEIPKSEVKNLRSLGVPMGEGFVTSIEISGDTLVYRWRKHEHKNHISRP